MTRSLRFLITAILALMKLKRQSWTLNYPPQMMTYATDKNFNMAHWAAKYGHLAWLEEMLKADEKIAWYILDTRLSSSPLEHPTRCREL